MVRKANNRPYSPAHKLLLDYRLTKWRKSALEVVQEANQGILRAYSEQLCLTEELVASLRNNKRFGDKLYWIIYITYLSNRQPGDVEEILAEIAKNHEPIPRRTYFRLRARAIEILDVRLNELAAKNSKN